MKRIRQIAILMAALALMTGCGSVRKAEKRQRVKPPVVADWQKPAQEPEKPEPPYRYLSATFSCEARGIEANGLLRACGDSVIWVSVSKVIELGRALLTPDSIMVYAKINNSYYTCGYDFLESRFGIKTDFATLQRELAERAKNPGKEETIPIRAKEVSADVKFKLRKADYPEGLTFPFSIPARAKRMTMSMFE